MDAMVEFRIAPYRPVQREAVLDLSLRAWEPVFPKLESAVPSFVYRSFYPEGWRQRQYDDLAAVLDAEPEACDVALRESQVVGWVCTKLHPEDSMGEVYVVAVDPEWQRQGIGRALMDHSLHRSRSAGMRRVMVETGGDPGHAGARHSYERQGFERWPVARYFKDLPAAAKL
jgi:ribosomal protein S18 acetylase RimI-like enzyme